MDPSRSICEIRDSFSSSNLKENIPQLTPFISTEQVSLKKDINLSVSSLDPLKFKDEYDELQRLKDLFDNPAFTDARNKANPFETLGRSVFMNRAAIKLANVDAIFNLTGQEQGFIIQQNTNPFTYCDVAGGPGGFTEYLQFRRPNSFGYGITLSEKHGGIPWTLDRIDVTRFKALYGGDGSGNLYTNSDWFVNYVGSSSGQEGRGVDLVVADGGFEIGNDSRQQEFLSCRLILCEIMIALQLLKKGGHFVCKVFDTLSPMMQHLLYVVGLSFDEVHIFKPVSSRPANAERYVVAKGYKGFNVTSQSYVRVLKEANGLYTDKLHVSTLLDQNEISPAFVEWLDANNELSLNSQTTVANQIIALMNGSTLDVPIPQYNLYKCLAIWNLPDNRRTKADKIFVRF